MLVTENASERLKHQITFPIQLNTHTHTHTVQVPSKHQVLFHSVGIQPITAAAITVYLD